MVSGDKKLHAVAVLEFELPLARVITYKYSVEEIQLIETNNFAALTIGNTWRIEVGCHLGE